MRPEDLAGEIAKECLIAYTEGAKKGFELAIKTVTMASQLGLSLEDSIQMAQELAEENFG